VTHGAKIATITQNRTITSPTIAILDANIMESAAHMRLKIPGFGAAVTGAIASSAVAMFSRLKIPGFGAAVTGAIASSAVAMFSPRLVLYEI
jgi:uncharacterized membrane protein YvlD (DUF360 family)